MLFTYLGGWTWPKRLHGQHVQHLFTDKRKTANAKAKTFKALASELLSLIPILAFFAATQVMVHGTCVPECTVIVLLADLLDLFILANVGDCTDIQLRSAIDAFMAACIGAEWRQYMTPKFHWLLHFPRHLYRFGYLPSCFVLERKHKVGRRYATSITNTINDEISVLGELLSHNLEYMKSETVFELSVGLQLPSPPNARLRSYVVSEFAPTGREELMTSHMARIRPAGTCAIGDIAFARSVSRNHFVAGEVLLHVSIDGICKSVLSLFRLRSYSRAEGAAEWDMVDNITVLDTHDLLCTVVYCKLSASVVRTLIPWRLRNMRPSDN